MYGCVSLLAISLSFLTKRFEFVLQGIDFTTSLLVQVVEVSLEGVHFSLESGLFLSVNHAALLVFNLAPAHLGLKFELFLMEVLLSLIKLPTHRVDHQLTLFQSRQVACFLFALGKSFLGFPFSF